MTDTVEDSGFFLTILHGVYALISLIFRAILRFGLSSALIASFFLTLHAAGQFSKQALQRRQDVLDLVYWRDPVKSGAVLATTLVTLIVFAKFPLTAVISYLALAVLGGTLGFRIYKLLEAQVRKTDGANPFQTYLNREFHLPQEKIHQQLDTLIEHAQLIGNELRRLFLVESVVDSVKFGLLLWALTYVSNWFSGLCILILAVLTVFTVPKVYEVYQEPIDHNISTVKQHLNDVNTK
ncbi:unnamed protein product [Thelazia callipaeda]|uniref:Reticulon-like protein n=1 Tax=Thelazia callipaeda TaxID=103827 RepID=A0A0N5CXQ7_THECL|nr:unnamed protein product [Thelazia callipaeda]